MQKIAPDADRLRCSQSVQDRDVTLRKEFREVLLQAVESFEGLLRSMLERGCVRPGEQEHVFRAQRPRVKTREAGSRPAVGLERQVGEMSGSAMLYAVAPPGSRTGFFSRP